MKKSVNARIILFFITGALSVCASIGIIITEILLANGIIGLLPVKACMITNGVLIALAIIQAYYLLKLPTTNK